MNWVESKLKKTKVKSIDSELVTGCINNNRRFQKKLYEKYCDAMYNVAYRICGDHDEANDILQDTFIQVFKDISKFKGVSTLGAWIKTITVRTALRKIKNKLQFEEIKEDIHTVHHSQYFPVNMDYLENAILRLSEGYRSIFLLVEVEGYSHKEVAQMLNISEGTSKSQLFYAKKHLRKYLSQYSIQG